MPNLQRLTAQWTQTTRACGDGDGWLAAGRGGHRQQECSRRGRPHLLGAVTHDGSIVLAQRQIPDKGSEISELAALVAELGLAGKVVTVAACTSIGPPPKTSCRPRALIPHDVKANQPGCSPRPTARCPARQPTSPSTPGRGHTETVHSAHRAGGHRDADRLPARRPVFRVIRYVGGLDGQRRSKEVAYCLTRLTPGKASAHDLGQLLRDHWGAIKNKPH